MPLHDFILPKPHTNSTVFDFLVIFCSFCVYSLVPGGWHLMLCNLFRLTKFDTFRHYSNFCSHFVNGAWPLRPYRNEVRFVLVDVCGWIACSDPTSCRCSNDVRANVDGVYRIREEVTDEDCGLNNSSIFSSSLASLFPSLISNWWNGILGNMLRRSFSILIAVWNFTFPAPLGNRSLRYTIFFSKFSCPYSFTHLCSPQIYAVKYYSFNLSSKTLLL